MHRHRPPLAAAPGLEGGADRRQGGHLLRIDRHQLARLVGQPDAGGVERKLDRLGNEQVELPAEASSMSWPGSALPGTRQRAERGRGSGSGSGSESECFDADVIRPRQRGDDLHSFAAADHAVVGRTAGDRQVEPVVVEDGWVPGARDWGLGAGGAANQSLSESAAADAERRGEHAAIKQHHIGRAGSPRLLAPVPTRPLLALNPGAPSVKNAARYRVIAGSAA